MNLLLVDDHPLFGLGFVHALAHGSPGVDVRTVLNLEQGLELADRWPALDCVLIDYRLGGDNGLDGLRRFGVRHPLVARVLISGDEDPALAVRARTAGAAGFFGKSMPMAELIAALQSIVRGGECFPSHGLAPVAARGTGPTARQLEVLALVAAGRQNKQIADELGIAERTVKLHITGLLALTGARNRTHLLVQARDLGLL
ncbi:response regulator transcription factor [uncultured Methylibium sp.]|uniref:LuxR C-terminal-related transcriptional regulator n=1 Tax=uncultured Methylibium sp. TaxID=381093 RepID=UPI0025EC0357|nr:response regulator transcription factor [uncultured Methylibium sp.]